MKTGRIHKPLNRLTLILGILVAVLAGLHTTVNAKEKNGPKMPAIEHQEIVELLEYLWDEDQTEAEAYVTIYNYQFELIYQGYLSEIEDPQIIVRSDVLMREGNQTIYVLQ